MADVDYGNDTEAALDLTFARREVDGETMMAQAITRRLTTPRGSLFYDPQYGYDLRRYAKGAVPSMSALNGAVENEILKDERVADVTVQTSFDTLTETLTVKIAGAGAFGPFDLTLAVGDVTVELLRGGTA